MSTDAFFQAMMLFIFCSFIVERSLVVLFETEYFISKFGRRKHIRPTIVILYTMLFVFIVDLNLALVIKDGSILDYSWGTKLESNLWNLDIIFMTVVFIAEGSKAAEAIQGCAGHTEILSSQVDTTDRGRTCRPAGCFIRSGERQRISQDMAF